VTELEIPHHRKALAVGRNAASDRLNDKTYNRMDNKKVLKGV